jgi:hypothetical protein
MPAIILPVFPDAKPRRSRARSRADTRNRPVYWTVLWSTLCACLNCPSELHGLHDGQTVETIIVALDTDLPPNAMLAPSCGDLGDLPAGAIMTSRVKFDLPADGCGSTLTIVPAALTTDAISDPDNSSATLTLPNGCAGTFSVAFTSFATNTSTDDTSYLDNSRANGQPHWWLVRTFSPDATAASCVANKRVYCSDAFVATNVER